MKMILFKGGGASALAMIAFAVLTCAGGSIAATRGDTLPYAQKPFPSGTAPVNVLGFRMGHDFAAIRKALQGLPTRGEFERADEYKARLDAAAIKPIYGEVRAADWLVRSGWFSQNKEPSDGLSYQYDADWETFSLCIGKLMEPDRIDDAQALVLKQRISSHSKNTGAYVGSNAFGAKTKVVKREEYVFSLAVPVTDVLGKHCFAPVKMAPNEVRRNLQGAMWILVGKVRPQVFRSYHHDKPTIGSPFEVSKLEESLVFAVDRAIAFNPLTGEVWYSERWDGDAITPQAED